MRCIYSLFNGAINMDCSVVAFKEILLCKV
ncbi:hypothetical protein P832_03261 [Enterobacter kobei]|uniref:Uncharacterized protein n=2 Tax=Enterobacterales TaxID=91347 RepID=A0A6N3CS59_ENTAG|nr:hypothetical protein L369_04315 [Enterobacter sp. MGH 23]ESN22998.1 hypothetical protein L368_03048 [Enterobacter sp. MGH 22]ESN24292.1 hypothetical protein L371_02102 [Enterobacter sp. MGH 25]EUL90122.1 hypothetical protein P827_00054 [Enterobacter kobei]EUM43808.1 hypothetical protein L383_03224 [Enterobacter sp. MGH 37]CAE7634827.1 hypothetical protein AI2762V1_4166 [Enterobacter cloacae]GFM07636.1 hypothetical protein NCT2013_00540 [Enterobacter sp. M4-VN]